MKGRVSMSKPLVALMSIMLAVVGLTGAAAAAPRSPAFTGLCGAMAGSAPSRVKHVMFILEENRSYRQVIGDAAALGDPYINGVLVPSCGLAANFHNFSHPSLPNYLALTSGKAAGTGTDTDCSKVANCPQPQSSIFSQLGNAGRSWREYAASMPANCYPSNSGKYLVRHAPPPYYTSSPVPAQCKYQDVPLGSTASGQLITALSATADGLPAFSFVTPNACDDMHSCPASAGDTWLKTWVPIIRKSAAYQHGQLVVFITWDEGEGLAQLLGRHACAQPVHQARHQVVGLLQRPRPARHRRGHARPAPVGGDQWLHEPKDRVRAVTSASRGRGCLGGLGGMG